MTSPSLLFTGVGGVFDRVGPELGELFAKPRFASRGDHLFARDPKQAIISAYDVPLGAVFEWSRGDSNP
jgi:hypothetical protein